MVAVDSALAALLGLPVDFASVFLVTGAFAVTGAALAAVDEGLAAADFAAVFGAAFTVTLDGAGAAFVKV